MRHAVLRADPSLALYEVKTMDERLGDTSGGRRFDTMLLAAFAAIALALAAMGIYAVVAHSVAQRTREVGIRLALGATGDTVVSMIVREGLVVPAVGLLAGIIGSLALTSVIRSALYGVSATSPVVYTVVTLVLGGCAAAACWIPARRAATVDPIVALKS
jgi:ABC-type antimicrobial peptide transport system permease subunit